MEDYVFEEGAADLGDTDRIMMASLSELFAADKDTLVVYNFMYGPAMESPCPYCTSILDALDRVAPNAVQRLNLVVVAKSPIARIREFARTRGWTNLRLLSSRNNNYNIDYFGENEEGGQQPALNVFARREGKIYHFFNTELMFAPAEDGQDPRHVDSIWPLWNLFDFTPEGRAGFIVKLAYGEPLAASGQISR